ncbi:MAG: VWA domain-containing protein [Verrucomicrobia bacterium]|nr:VWA domain-containing protein [Verrucomicrobiota bacterium]
MKFAHLWLLWLIPPALAGLWLALAWGRRRRRKLSDKFTGDPAHCWSAPGFSETRRRLGTLLLLVAVGSMLLALARPLRYAKANEEELQGIPYIVALDASRSMLATDVKPTRYGAASNALDRWLTDSTADRVGITTFAGEAFLNAPITFDTEALRTVLRFIEPEEIYEGGSSLALAIERVGKYFVSNNLPQRVLIIISDGEEVEGDAIEEARKWHREARMAVSTVGVGTSIGAKVPVHRRGGAWSVARNAFGQEVTTRLDEGNLKRIANAGGGRYFLLGANGEGLDQLRQDFLRPLAEAAAKDNLNNYRELYHIPLVLCLCCVLFRLWLRPESYQSRVATAQRPLIR